METQALDHKDSKTVIFKTTSSVYKQALESGLITLHNRQYVTRPLNVVSSSLGLAQEVEFELLETSHQINLKTFLQSLRAYSFPVSILPCVLVFATIQGELFFSSAIPAALSVVFLHAAVNLWNDYYDYKKLIDLPGELGGSGVLTQGLLPAKKINQWAYGFFFLALISALPTILASPFISLSLLVAVAVGSLGYTNSFFGLKYKAMGDLAVFFLCGPFLFMGLTLAATHQIEQTPWALSVLFGFLAMGILHANNHQDREIDKNRGAKTIANSLTFEQSKRFFAVLYAGAFLALLFTAVIGQLNWWSVVATSLVFALLVKTICLPVLTIDDLKNPKLAKIREQTAQFYLAVGVTLLIATLVENLWS